MPAIQPRVSHIKQSNTREFLNIIFEEDLHAKRINSLADAALGVIVSSSLAIHLIGQGLATAKGLNTKHAIKQVDRLMSNKGIDVWECFDNWVSYVIGERKEIIAAMDWTEFEKDDQSTIMISLVTNHGRTTPLIWKTVCKSTLKSNRNNYEDEVLRRLREIIPEDVKLTLLADRGFGDQKLYKFLMELNFEFVIRFRSNIKVTSADGVEQTALKWVGKNGRSKTLRNAMVTHDKYQIPTIVCTHAKDMKEAWCLVASDPNGKAKEIVNYYAKRWTIEPMFRDIKDHHYGMGMYSVRINKPDRRDRLFFISAIAMMLLSLLGAAGEALGFDKMLKANTVKYRVHSLFRQGCMWYQLIPNMPSDRLTKLMIKFEELLDKQRYFKNIFEVV